MSYRKGSGYEFKDDSRVSSASVIPIFGFVRKVLSAKKLNTNYIYAIIYMRMYLLHIGICRIYQKCVFNRLGRHLSILYNINQAIMNRSY